MKFPVFGSYLGPEADIIKDKAFEKAITKLQRNSSALDLTQDEQATVQLFREFEEPSASTIALTAVEKARENKKRRVVFSPYRSVSHVLPTSNIIERRFSQAKMDPENWDTLLFLKYNKCRWSILTVQAFLCQ